LERLKIFTLGEGDGKSTEKNQDEIYTRMLLDALDLDPEKFLFILSAESLEPLNRKLYEEHVFCDFPRLITPHPLLRSQIRNTVVMSSMLYAIQKDHPDAITLLTGDGADELLAGYSEMVQGKRNAEEVREQICTRVNYFPLTDGARVALASFYGSTAAKWLEEPSDTTAPVEIRSPFTSHLFMEALSKGHPDFLFGIMDDVRSSKLPIRLLGKNLGIPKELVIREKMPFHEGATGEKIGGPSELEQAVVLEFMEKEEMVWNGPELNGTRRALGFPQDKQTSSTDLLPGLTDQITVFFVAQGCGAERLFQGSMFQNQPTQGRGLSYFPSKPRYIDF